VCDTSRWGRQTLVDLEDPSAPSRANLETTSTTALGDGVACMPKWIGHTRAPLPAGSLVSRDRGLALSGVCCHQPRVAKAHLCTPQHVTPQPPSTAPVQERARSELAEAEQSPRDAHTNEVGSGSQRTQRQPVPCASNRAAISRAGFGRATGPLTRRVCAARTATGTADTPAASRSASSSS
jgi:hypothetical protein